MKKVLLAAAMAMMSVSAFANMCEVDMVDNRGLRIETFSAYDYNNDCQEGMKVCRKKIRDTNRYGRADCVRSTVSYPNPNPRPYPNPNPNPGPIGSSDVRRMLNSGETAIMGNRYVTVMGSSFNGLYAVRSNDVWNTITNNVRREALSVTNGCVLNICTRDTVIDINSARFVSVEGISFDGRIVTKSMDVFNTLLSGIDSRNLAVTKNNACSYLEYGRRACVNDRVITQQNRDATIVGIQEDGNVVIKSSDVWETISTRINPRTLVITGSTNRY